MMPLPTSMNLEGILNINALSSMFLRMTEVCFMNTLL